MQQQDRFKNILVIVIGLTAIAWIFHVRYLAEISFGIGLIALLIPAAARGIEWAWLKLALGLGWVNSRILLSLVYFLFLMPIAFLSRLFTKDPLQLKARGSASLYTTRNHKYTREDLENIW